MDRYIEVTGEGQCIETASRFIAHVTLEVRAAKDEYASRDLAEMVSSALAVLRDAGIAESELVEGGRDLHRPWYWKKKVGQVALRTIILKVDDFPRLSHALDKLESIQLKNKELKSISVGFRQPEFEETGEGKSAALVAAFQDAHAKAQRLASAMDATLGKPIYTEEGGWSRRNSGFSGDEDWGGDYGRFAVAGAAAGGGGEVALGASDDSSSVTLQNPTRTIFIKCRVRFAIE